MENLKALVYGHELNNYQKKLAQNEFEKIELIYDLLEMYNLKDINILENILERA